MRKNNYENDIINKANEINVILQRKQSLLTWNVAASAREDAILQC